MSETYKLVRTVGKNDARKTDGKNTRGYTRYAKVARVDPDGTAWVDLSGDGTSLTPATLDTGAKRGDVVRVSVSDHAAHVTGNMTSPATDDTAAEAARKRADEAARDAESAVEDAAAAREAADEANKVAQATNQHFWSDTSGAHITDVTQDEWAAAVDDNFSDYDPDTKPYHNQLLNSLGILLRTALNNLVSITRSAIAFYDGEGNDAGNIVARFGSDGAQIGKSGESHMELDYHSLILYDKENQEYVHLSDLRDAEGRLTDTFVGNGSTTDFELSYAWTGGGVVYIDGVLQDEDAYSDPTVYKIRFNTAPPNGSSVIVKYKPWQYYYPNTQGAYATKAYTLGLRNSSYPVGYMSFAEGFLTSAEKDMAHAEGYSSRASGIFSHAEGNHTIANGDYSHAEGYYCTSNGRYSHAEGSDCDTPGDYSHAEGSHTEARGRYSHAEGNYSKTTGDYSHAQNRYTKASSDCQTAMGKYNVEDDQDTYALIIGNGTSDTARSNALTVDWDGVVDCGAIAPKWVTIDPSTFFSSMNSGWANDTSYTQLAYSPTLRRVVGRFRIYSTAAHSTGNNVIGTVAVAYRPYVRALCCTTTTRTHKLYLDANGNATLALDTATTATQTAFFFVADYTMA